MSRKQNTKSVHGYRPTKMLGKTLIGEPNVGHTQTFISIGCFDTEREALNCKKYAQTKFFNAMLSTLKVTQDNAMRTFQNIPLQDFTENSDIDWDAPLREIAEHSIVNMPYLMKRYFGLSNSLCVVRRTLQNAQKTNCSILNSRRNTR